MDTAGLDSSVGVLVAYSDARPNGDQEVAVRSLPRQATFFRGDWLCYI